MQASASISRSRPARRSGTTASRSSRILERLRLSGPAGPAGGALSFPAFVARSRDGRAPPIGRAVLPLLLALQACRSGNDGAVTPADDRTGPAPVTTAAPDRSPTPPPATPAAGGQVRYTAALTYFNKGDHRAALRELEKLLAEAPTYGEAWFLKGNAHLKLGEADQAVASIAKALDLDPGSSAKVFLLGVAHREAGDDVEALRCFRRALELEPLPTYVIESAGLFASRGDFASAQTLYELGVGARPEDARLRRELADTLAVQDKLGEAIVAYREALERAPRDERALYNYGVALQRDGRRQEAIEAYRKALEANPRNPEAHLNLGIALVEEGDARAAIASFEEYLRLRPDAPDAGRTREQIELLERGAATEEDGATGTGS